MTGANPNDPEALALAALAATLTDARRAERFLSLTGLSPDGIRLRLTDRALLAACIGFLEGHEPDLVITDIQLPHVTGLELMELIRQDAELCDVPIMAVTAYSGVGDDERIRAAGAQAYVAKPISVVRFAETVEELLAGKSLMAVPAEH
jgi:CheY-like chemotaxis protein